MQELYGAKVAGDLISALSRLFTAYLHFGGFTCGLDDLLLIQAAERERFELCETAELRALRASAEFADVKMPSGEAEVHSLSNMQVTSGCLLLVFVGMSDLQGLVKKGLLRGTA